MNFINNDIPDSIRDFLTRIQKESPEMERKATSLVEDIFLYGREININRALNIIVKANLGEANSKSQKIVQLFSKVLLGTYCSDLDWIDLEETISNELSSLEEAEKEKKLKEYHFAEILIERLPQIHRNIVSIRTILHLFQGAGNHSENLFKAFDLCPPEEIVPRIQLGNPLLKKFSNLNERALILAEIVSLPLEEIELILLQIQAMSNEIASANETVVLLRKVPSIAPPMRVDLLSYASLLSKKVRNPNQGPLILQNLVELVSAGVPFEELEKLILQATPLLNERTVVKLKEILQLLFDFPENVRHRSIDLTLYLCKRMKQHSDYIPILSALRAIPFSEWDPLLEDAEPLFQGLNQGIQSVLVELHAIPKKYRKEILDLAKPFLFKTSDGMQRGDLLKTVWALPNRKRKDILESANPLIREMEKGETIKQILLALNSFPQNQIKNVSKQALNFVQGLSENFEYYPFLNSLVKIPFDRRDQILSLMTPLFEFIKTEQKRLNFFVEFGGFTLEQQEDFVKLVLPLIAFIDEKQLFNLTKLFPLISRELLTPDVLQDLILLIHQIGYVEPIAEQICATPPEILVKLISKAVSLLWDSSNERDRENLIKILNKIPSAQWDEIVSESRSVLETHHSPHLIAMMEMLSKLDLAERKEVKHYAQSFFEQIENDGLRVKAIEAVIEVPRKSRKEFFEGTKSLFVDLQPNERVEFLKIISSIDLESLNEIRLLAAPYLQDISSGSERGEFFKDLYSLTREHCAHFLSQAKALIPDLKNKNQRQEIFKALNLIPFYQRAEVVAMAPLFLKGIQEVSEISSVLNALAIMPSEKEPFIKELLPELLKISNGTKRSAIIRGLLLIPKEDRQKNNIDLIFDLFKNCRDVEPILEVKIHQKEIFQTLRLAWPLVKELSQGKIVAEILTALIPYHHPHNQKIVEKVSFLLKKLPSPNGIPSLMHALRKFPLEEIDDLLNKALSLSPYPIEVENLVRLLCLFNEVPKKEREAFVKQGKPLSGNPIECATFLYKLKEIPSTERKDLLEVTVPLFEGGCSTPFRQSAIELIYTIPKEERVPFVRDITPLFSLIKDQSEKTAIIKKFYICKKEEIKRKLEALLNFQKHHPTCLISECFIYIHLVPIDQLDSLLNLTEQLSQGYPDEHLVLMRLSLIPYTLWPEITQNLIPLLERVNSKGKAKLIETYFSLPENVRKELFDQLLPLLSEQEDLERMKKIVLKAAEIPIEFRKEALEKLMPHLLDIKDDEILQNLLDELKKGVPLDIPSLLLRAQPSSLQENLSTLLPTNAAQYIPKKDLESIRTLLESSPVKGSKIESILYGIEPEQRKEILDAAIQVAHQLGMNSENDLVVLLEGLYSIPSERAKVLKLAKPFLQRVKEIPSMYKILEIFRNLAPLLKLYGDSIPKEAEPFIKGLYNPIEQTTVLTAFCTHLPQNLQRLQAALPYILDQQCGKSRKELIKAFLQIEPDQLDSIFAILPLVFRRTSHSSLRVGILRTLMKLSSEQCLSLKKLDPVLSILLRKNLEAIEGLKAFPLEEWNSSLVYDLTQYNQFEQVLKELYSIPIQERAFILKECLPFLQFPEVSHHWILQILKNLTSGQRKDLLHCMTSVFHFFDHSHFYLSNESFSQLVDLFLRYSHEQPNEYLSQWKKILRRTVGINYSIKTLKALLKIPVGERDAMIDDVLFLGRNMKEFYSDYFIKVLMGTNQAQRKTLIKYYTQIQPPITNSSAACDLIKKMRKIPEELLDQHMTMALEIAQNGHVDVILDLLENISFNDCKNLMAYAEPLMAYVEIKIWSLGFKSDLLLPLQKIPKAQLPSLIAIQLELFREIGSQAPLVLDELLLIPPDQRQQVLNLSIHFIRHTKENSCFFNLTVLIPCVSRIPQEQRGDLVAKMIKITGGKETFERSIKILNICSSIDLEVRDEIFENYLFQFCDLPSAYHQALALKAISTLPKDLRDEPFVKSLKKLLHHSTQSFIESEFDRDPLNEALSAIPSRLRLSVMQAVLPLLKGKVSEITVSILLKQVALLDSRDQDEVLQLALFLNQYNTYHTENLIKFIKGIENLPSERRKKLIYQTFYIWQGKATDEKIEIIQEASKIPQKQLKLLLPFLNLFLLKNFKFQNPAELLQAIKEIPLQKLKHLIHRMDPLFSGSDLQDPILILKTLAPFPEDQYQDLIESCLPMFYWIPSLPHRATLISHVASIASDQRTAILSKWVSLMKLFRGNEAEKVKLLSLLSSIPSKEREKSIEQLEPFFNRISGLQMLNFMSEFLSIPFEQRDEISHVMQALLKDLTIENHTPFLIRLLKSIPSEEREEIVNSWVPKLKRVSHKLEIMLAALPLSKIERNDFFNSLIGVLHDKTKIRIKKSGFFSALRLLPPERRKEAVERLIKSPQIFKGKFLANLIDQDPTLLPDIYHYLLKELQNAITIQDYAYELSKQIMDSSEILRLHHEHPLFQKVIEVYVISDPSQDQKKNPYAIFCRLKKLYDTEPRYSGDLPPLQFKNQSISINIKTLQERAQKKGYTFKDLPSRVSPDTFKVLFDKLETRIFSLPKEKREEVESYIQDSFATRFKNLKANIFEKELITSLLNLKGAPDDPIEFCSYYLHFIINRILDAADTLEEGMLLSPREEMILSFSSSIYNCSTGQREGIVNYYNSLPAEERVDKQIALGDDIEKFKCRVDQSVQDVLNDVISGTQLLTVLTGSVNFPQLSHQTLYLKNRLCGHVGYIHCPTLDLHTGVLEDALQNANLANLIKAFFECCTCFKLIEKLRQHVAQGLQSKTITYNQLQKYLEPHIKSQLNGEKPTPEHYQQYIEVDEDFIPQGITEEGALAILILSDYIKRH